MYSRGPWTISCEDHITLPFSDGVWGQFVTENCDTIMRESHINTLQHSAHCYFVLQRKPSISKQLELQSFCGVEKKINHYCDTA